ncbi:MAG: peptidyl-prolyl cis-trans isomerase [Candidatus Poribacteria bacterium]|nr:peptidyl-prolyl cis-trans isomerase [Candidatus Poribacteria bacterium]
MIIFLREKFIAQLFMWVIAIVFLVGTVFLYSNTRGGGEGPEGEVVLRINNTEVKRGEFENAVANAMESQRRSQQRFGPAPDLEQTQKSVIDRLVQQTILGSVDIGYSEIERYIRSDATRVNQYNLYQQYGAVDLYTENIRLQLSSTALRDSVQGLELVTDIEAEQAYRLESDKAKVKFIEFNYNDYASIIEVDDAEAKAYFEENRDDYKIEEQINVKFVKVNPADFVSDEEVRTYYEENQAEFTTPEAVKARHILKKFPDNATDEQKVETKAAAEELLKTINTELAAGADFAELAKTHSEGPSSVQGGALRGRNPKLPPGDYFTRGEMVKPFEEAAFDTLEPGKVSGLVETDFGYHIIKLEERRAPEVQPFAQVQYEIQQRLVQVSGVDEAKRIADDLLFEIEIQDYDEALALERYKDLSLTALETGLFSRNATTIPQIGARWGYQGLIEELFDTEVNVIKVIDAKKSNGEQVEAYFVAKVLEKKPAAIPPFEEIKTEVIEGRKTGETDGLRREKAKEWAFTDAQNLFNQRVDLTSLDALLEKYETPEGLAADRLSVQESNLFVLSPSSDYIAGMGNSSETMFAAFRLKVDEIGGPFKGGNAVYIIQLVEREEPDIATFETDPAEKTRHRQALIQAKKREAYLNWFAARKKESELWIHPDYR